MMFYVYVSVIKIKVSVALDNAALFPVCLLRGTDPQSLEHLGRVLA
jgi:hypothetical protein